MSHIKIWSFKINEETPVSNLDSYFDFKLSGNPAICFDSIDKGGYADITSIENWKKYEHLASDYQVVRDGIKKIVYEKGWDNLSNNEKEIAINYYAYISLPYTLYNNSSLNDLTSGRVYTGDTNAIFDIEIDSTGFTDTFKWQINNSGYTTGVTITEEEQYLYEGFSITFNRNSGHNLNDSWKIYFHNQADIEKIMFLMTYSGMSQYEAQEFLLTSWHKHHIKFLETCKIRWEYIKKKIIEYLSIRDSEDLFDTVSTLVFYYLQSGRLGRLYGDNSDGMMDYVYSHNGFKNQGLEENNYKLKKGTWKDFKNDLKNIIVDGEYKLYKKI